MCVNFQENKRCFQFLEFVKLYSDKKLQTISFWQLGKKKKKEKRKKKEYVCGKKSFIFYFFLKNKLYQYLTTNVREKCGCGKNSLE